MLNKLLHFFLSKWFFISYFSLGVSYLVVSRLTVAATAWAQCFFMTLGLMTGSDPYSFKDAIGPNSLTWVLAWPIHIGSWLLMPALIGLLVNDAAQGIKNQQRLQIAIARFLQAAGIKEVDLSEFTAKLHGQLDEMIAESQREEEHK